VFRVAVAQELDVPPRTFFANIFRTIIGHINKVREAVGALRERIEDINHGLSKPDLPSEQRKALENELGKASRGLDAGERALEGRTIEPPKEGPKSDSNQGQPTGDSSRLNSE
jgi:Coiled-coil domain-containing protein 167